MKFVHIADMHFDAAFTSLDSKKGIGDLRRLEQREVLKKVINYIKQNNIEYLFISGDLYEQELIRKSTIEYINNLFKEIINTQIYIAPGNHDPYIYNSFYNKFNWSENVHIFTDKINKFETEEADIYGYGFTDFYCKNSNIEETKIENEDKINVLVVHGSIDAIAEENKEYNPISTKKLKESKFEYIALGHIHKTNYSSKEQNKVIYPGSTISFGFDELGEHGMIAGEINKNKINIEFIKLDERIFIEKQIDINEINSEEELVEYLNNLYLEEKTENKIIFIGKRNFEININNINKLIQNKKITKIKDNSSLKYNLEEIAKENNLKGIFVKECLNKLKTGLYNEKEIIKAIEMGLEVLK